MIAAGDVGIVLDERLSRRLCRPARSPDRSGDAVRRRHRRDERALDLDASARRRRARLALLVDERERARLARRDPERLGAEIAERVALGVGELAAKRDVGAFPGRVLGVDEHERRLLLELTDADRVGAKRRVGGDANEVEIELVRLGLGAAADRHQRQEPRSHAWRIAGPPRRGRRGNYPIRQRDEDRCPRRGECSREPSERARARPYRTLAIAVASVVTRSSSVARLSMMTRYSPFTLHRPPVAGLEPAGLERLVADLDPELIGCVLQQLEHDFWLHSGTHTTRSDPGRNLSVRLRTLRDPHTIGSMTRNAAPPRSDRPTEICPRC